MYYSADEHICVSVADSPYGPFKQEVQKPMIEGEKRSTVHSLLMMMVLPICFSTASTMG